MRQNKVGNLMTSDVVSVLPPTPFKDVAKLLAEHDISGLPVVDEDDKVLGVISESDLMLRQAALPAEPAPPHRRWLSRHRDAAPTRAPAPTAEGLMSHPAITVHADDTIAEAARTMARHRIERLPVLDEEERLVGIVTRRDLLQVFLRPDADIRREVIADVVVGTMWLTPATLDVRVLDGVVTLKGQLERRSEVSVLLRLTEQVDGVVSAVDELTYRIDDSRPPRPAEQTLLGLAED
ncbi:CBS domain-containing protein [Streptomyces sp. NPDC052396]|uniref:CBS domain-containing protein n=1 Tax=Streptomyces sp. NPDC052396 TaxID=3365689 RepID=UPI0037D8C783